MNEINILLIFFRISSNCSENAFTKKLKEVAAKPISELLATGEVHVFKLNKHEGTVDILRYIFLQPRRIQLQTKVLGRTMKKLRNQ